MTTTEAIAYINNHLASFSQKELSIVASITESLASARDVDIEQFSFTPEQLTLIDRSFDDFKHGRTVGIDDLDQRVTGFLKTVHI